MHARVNYVQHLEVAIVKTLKAHNDGKVFINFFHFCFFRRHVEQVVYTDGVVRGLSSIRNSLTHRDIVQDRYIGLTHKINGDEMARNMGCFG